ncbi:zinc ABC transporter substrate-binding protein [Streptomyces sp. HSG2]|uniref:metal ABC transporter substrate-binding protein n=1 Tax=Streptomyces sp. HSG2 TaxID=2797167 RepID=UPI001902CE4C|nr:zinc ABC transporter substrate-binding protein [Streptomyces sp. HSG2]
MNARRRRISGIAVAAATALSLLSACGSDSADASADTEGRLDVVASFYPMAFLAERIGGDHVSVTDLVEPGQEPHDLVISAKQTAQLQDADVAVYLKGLQPSVDEAIAQSGIETKIDATTLTSLEVHGTTEDHDHEEADEHEHADEDGHDHDSALDGEDPHIWLDPVRYAEVATGVGEALEKADPDNAADYESNTAALVEELNALDTSFAEGLEDRASDVFITSHAAFGYLAERYGLTQEAISGLSPESEPSAARIKELQRTAQDAGATTVFYETLVSDSTAKTLAEDTGLRTDVLDPLEGITDASRGDDYFAVMESNLTALRKALGAT